MAARFWSVLAVDKSIDLVGFARRKLTRYNDINTPESKLPPYALTALVDILIKLDFEPRREAHEHLVEMVAGGIAGTSGRATPLSLFWPKLLLVR